MDHTKLSSLFVPLLPNDSDNVIYMYHTYADRMGLFRDLRGLGEDLSDPVSLPFSTRTLESFLKVLDLGLGLSSETLSFEAIGVDDPTDAEHFEDLINIFQVFDFTQYSGDEFEALADAVFYLLGTKDARPLPRRIMQQIQSDIYSPEAAIRALELVLEDPSAWDPITAEDQEIDMENWDDRVYDPEVEEEQEGIVNPNRYPVRQPAEHDDRGYWPRVFDRYLLNDGVVDEDFEDEDEDEDSDVDNAAYWIRSKWIS